MADDAAFASGDIMNKYNALYISLTTLNNCALRYSEAAHSHTCAKALQLVDHSELGAFEKSGLKARIQSSANPSGWYYEGNGIDAAVFLLVEHQRLEQVA